MTAVNKKLLKNSAEKQNLLNGINFTDLAICFFIALSAAKAEIADIRLGILAFVLAASRQDTAKKAALSAGSALMFIILSVSDSTFIPYLLTIAVYTVASSALKSEKQQIIAALIIFAVGKLMIFGGGVWQQAAFTFLECVGAYLLISILKTSGEIYNTFHSDISFTDMIYLLITAMVVTFALSGMDSHRLYVGSAAALAISWLYIRNGSAFYSLLGLLCFFLSMADKQGFAYLFICGFAVWAAGAALSEKFSVLIYPFAVGTAFIGNLIFLPDFNGFVLLGTTLAALLLYTLLPFILNFTQSKKPEIFSEEKDYRQLLISMKKLEESLSFLGNCAIDISRLNEKNLKAVTLEDAVAEDVCRKCEYNSHCWQEKYSFTSRQFSKYAKSMNYERERGFDMGFYSQCRQIEKLKASFDENSRLLLSRKYILQSRKNNQKLLQTAFMSISATVGEMLRRSRTSRMVNSAFTMQLDKTLSELGASQTYCLCSQNPDRANFSVISPLSDSDLYKIKTKLEHLYEEKFSDGDFETQGKELIYTFYAKPVFSYEYRTENSAYRQVNGDASLVLPIEDKLYVLLSDGMGTGSAAAAESRTVLAMAKSLIECGISIDSMMNIINLSLNLRGSGESGASLEVLQIDLFTGKAVLTKAGAGISAVINEKGITRYYRDSLPLGILKDVKYSTDEFTLTVNDTVILMSDGVGNVSANIKNLYSQSCEEIARFAINENKTLDDKTVIALKLTII